MQKWPNNILSYPDNYTIKQKMKSGFDRQSVHDKKKKKLIKVYLLSRWTERHHINNRPFLAQPLNLPLPKWIAVRVCLASEWVWRFLACPGA